MRGVLTLAVIVAAACTPKVSDERLVVPAELKQLRENALACSRDVQYTRIENSEHCALTAENIFEVSKPECEKIDTKDCRNFSRVQDDIYSIFQGAIAESLFEHGKGRLVEILSKDYLWRNIYLNGEIMRRLYQKCLERETQGLAKKGLVPATSIPMIPLQDGQQCFRAGYPAFETKALQTQLQQPQLPAHLRRPELRAV